MLDPLSSDLLNFRPNISFVSPKSEDVIPEVAVEVPVSKEDQVKQLRTGFDNVVKIADAVEKGIDSRVGKFVAKLNIADSPEDMATAQALARIFPKISREIAPGIHVVEQITYDMFKQCVHELEEHGKEQAKKSLLPKAENVNINRTSFGGINNGSDNRPEINNITAPIAPINIPAFIAAGIPILFAMLFPLISSYVKTQVVGHTHPVVPAAPGVPVPSGPGIPVIP